MDRKDTIQPVASLARKLMGDSSICMIDIEYSRALMYLV